MLLSSNWVDLKILGVILIVMSDSQPPESNLLIELIWNIIFLEEYRKPFEGSAQNWQCYSLNANYLPS